MKKVAVSIHAIDNFSVNILKDIEGFDYIHVDFMDGKFVDNKNDNIDAFRILKESYKTPIIAHLMVIEPLKYIAKIVSYVDYFLFHFENVNNRDKVIKEIRKFDKKVGFAINPGTSITEIIPYLNKIDLVLIMSVNPGWSGQKFLINSVEKVNKLAKYKKENDFIIDIDGGINLKNAQLLKNTDILTSSSAILKAEDPNKTIKLLRESDENG